MSRARSREVNGLLPTGVREIGPDLIGIRHILVEPAVLLRPPLRPDPVRPLLIVFEIVWVPPKRASTKQILRPAFESAGRLPLSQES